MAVVSPRVSLTGLSKPGRRQGGRQWLQVLNISLLRNIVFAYFVLSWLRRAVVRLRGRGLLGSIQQGLLSIRRHIYILFLRTPGIRSKIEASIAASKTKIETRMLESAGNTTRRLELPARGLSVAEISSELDQHAALTHSRWEDGQVSGAVYHGGTDIIRLQTEAFEKFNVSNPLHPAVFPAVRKMEAEIVSMLLGVFHAPAGACGVTTSGGTESVLMACLSARQKARHERAITRPEIIIPETAHAAFEKACFYFGIAPQLVPCPAPSYQVDLAAVARLINSNTILLVGSAPNYPHGIIDDLSGLSRLALRHRLPLHVDACLGSLLVPFLARAGFPTQPFDFTLRGVTSISCDTHKYGFAPKGSSALLYRNSRLRAYQYFITTDWTGGVYGSATIAGSRPGSLIAATWASLLSLGEKGYIDTCHRIVGAAKRFETALRTHPVLAAELRVIGTPRVSVVAFRTVAPESDNQTFSSEQIPSSQSDQSPSASRPRKGPLRARKSLDPALNIYALADTLAARGWHLSALQNPPALHVAVTLPMVSAIDRLVADLVLVVEEARENLRTTARGIGTKGNKKIVKAPEEGDNAALYGVAGSLPDKSIVRQVAEAYLDALYKA